MVTIKTTTHENNWSICTMLENNGYKLKSNCVWCKIYAKDNDKIVVSLELN